MAELLKEQFFNRTTLSRLAEFIKAEYNSFDKDKFINLLFDDKWQNKELKDRMHHVARCLGETLPADYPDALAILMNVAHNIRGFDSLAFPDFVEIYGLNYPELSLDALKYFTRFGSSEFAVRPFILRQPEMVMQKMLQWAGDENPHVRRLASEGCRPRLPWAVSLPVLKKDPAPVLPILEKLKDDESEYVRKSVANNLNDISKDHPELVLKIAASWLGSSVRTDWVIKRALRGLLKSGNSRALELFGFNSSGEVSIGSLKLDKSELKIGEVLEFSFILHSGTEEEHPVRLEYKIYYVKKSGSLSPKVFQISEKPYRNGTYEIKRRHSFQERTTRRHNPGLHVISIVANGIEKARAEFNLKQ